MTIEALQTELSFKFVENDNRGSDKQNRHWKFWRSMKTEALQRTANFVNVNGNTDSADRTVIETCVAQ